MSEVSNAVAIYGLQASLATEQTNASGIVPVGPSQTQRTFLDADVAYAFRANLPNVGDVATVDLATANGIAEPNDSEYPFAIEVTGTLSFDGVDPLVVPTLTFDGLNDGKPSYVANTDDFDFIVIWDEEGGEWKFNVTAQPSAVMKSWFSTDNVTEPTLVTTWQISGDDGNTGTPTVSAGEYDYPQLIDADGNDIYGQPIPTVAEINGLLIECVSGAATITGADGFEYSPTANAVLQISNTSTGVITPDDLTIEATSADTAVKVTVIGKTAS